MHDVVSLDRAHGLELDRLAARLAEEPRAAAEEQRRDVDVHRVDEARPQVLLRDIRASADPDVEVARRRLRPLSAASMPSVTKMKVVPPP